MRAGVDKHRMQSSGVSLCFTCGLEVGDPPRLNRRSSGELCGTCQSRVLDSLPALLPGRGTGSFPKEPEGVGSEWTPREPGEDGRAEAS